MTDLTSRWPFTAEEVRALKATLDALHRVGKPEHRGWEPELRRAYEAIGLVLTLMGHVWAEDTILPKGEPTLRQLIEALATEVAELRRSVGRPPPAYGV